MTPTDTALRALTPTEALGVALSVQAETMEMSEAQERAPAMLEHLHSLGYALAAAEAAPLDPALRALEWIILRGGLRLPDFDHWRERSSSKPSDPDDVRWDCSCGYAGSPETVEGHWSAMLPALAAAEAAPPTWDANALMRVHDAAYAEGKAEAAPLDVLDIPCEDCGHPGTHCKGRYSRV